MTYTTIGDIINAITLGTCNSEVIRLKDNYYLCEYFNVLFKIDFHKNVSDNISVKFIQEELDLSTSPHLVVVHKSVSLCELIQNVTNILSNLENEHYTHEWLIN